MQATRVLAAPSKLSVLAMIAFALSGCFDSERNGTTAADSTGNVAPPAATPPSVAPPAATITLQGVAPTKVIVGANYYFRPTVTPSSAGVTFTASGLPAWLDFDGGTGALHGIPAAKDEGTTGHIAIAANNGGSGASLTPFTIQVSAAASQSAATGAVKLSWVAPTKNTDGSPVTDLAGYHIYYGTSAGELTNTIEITGAASTTYVIGDLTTGTYYFSVLAYNSAGLDSGQSNVADETI
jgi:Putative Ig domain